MSPLLSSAIHRGVAEVIAVDMSRKDLYIITAYRPSLASFASTFYRMAKRERRKIEKRLEEIFERDKTG